jgi:hypothetical protein
MVKTTVAAVALPTVVVTAAEALPPRGDGIRVSSDKDDPGYSQWAMFNGDGKKVEAYLNGELQKHCMTADEKLGMVKRAVLTPSGNMAIGHDEFLFEEVFGDVRVVIS